MITDSEDRSMIAELEQIIQDEEAKPEKERDADLIDDCICEIAELKGVRSDYSDEEIDRITDTLVKKAEKEKKRKRFIHLAAGIAAAFVIFSGVTACTINPALINWLVQIVKMPFGSSVESETITYTNQGTTQKYKDISDFFIAENIDIYYPSILPKNVRLVSINHFTNDGQNHYMFIYTKPNLYFIVETMFSEHEFEEEWVTEIDCNDLHFNVYMDIFDSTDVYCAICEINEVRYILQSDNMQDIMLIIGGIKKS